MSTHFRQYGMSFTEFLFYSFLVAFFGNLLFGVGPLYLSNYRVKSALETMRATPGLTELPREVIMDRLQKLFDMNDIRNVPPQSITLLKHSGYVRIDVIYDRTVHVVANVDATVHFAESIQVGQEPGPGH